MAISVYVQDIHKMPTRHKWWQQVDYTKQQRHISQYVHKMSTQEVMAAGRLHQTVRTVEGSCDYFKERADIDDSSIISILTDS